MAFRGRLPGAAVGFAPDQGQHFAFRDVRVDHAQRQRLAFVGRIAAEHGEADDIAKTYTGLFQPGADVYKFFDLPIANYGSSSFDKVVDKTGKTVGLSMFAGYSTNERQALSLGVVDPNIQEGEVLTLVWGEPNGGSKKLTAERHKQLEVRVKVSQVPYARDARETYAQGWRTRQPVNA